MIHKFWDPVHDMIREMDVEDIRSGGGEVHP